MGRRAEEEKQDLNIDLLGEEKLPISPDIEGCISLCDAFSSLTRCVFPVDYRAVTP